MEWVAYLAGEPHSDQPVCVSPMLKSFCVSLNDALPDVQRQRMRPYLARTIGTVADGLDEDRRWLCADWLIREYTPAWLDLVPALQADAAALRSLPPVLAVENVQRAMVDLGRSRKNATAARDAAWAAARDAVWDAAGDAAAAAARTRDALEPTVLKLQDSVLRPCGLLDRMLPLEPITVPVVVGWREVCGV
jgi:hypothetical protein